MKITCKYKDINVDVELEDRICCFHGDSGEGKTFLFKILRDTYVYRNMADKILYIDYLTYRDIDINSPKLQDESALIILDNADLYRDTVKHIVANSKATVVISVNTILGLFGTYKFGRYSIKHNSDEISVRKKVL